MDWRELLNDSVANDEAGHTLPSVAAIIGGAGAIALGIGAANDTGWLAVTGGIAAGVGIIGFALAQHLTIDYDVFGRLDKLEKHED
jgi:hypothetical protein